MFSIFDETDIVLFDEFGIYAEVEQIYPDEHYDYYQDMYEVNGVDYYQTPSVLKRPWVTLKVA